MSITIDAPMLRVATALLLTAFLGCTLPSSGPPGFRKITAPTTVAAPDADKIPAPVNAAHPAGSPEGTAVGDDVPASGTTNRANGGSWEDRHILEPGDVIHLEVFREPEVSGTFRLTGNGVVRHPLLGEVELGGLSPSQAETLIRERLAAQFLVNPRVILKVEKTSSLQVLIIGEVRNPGVLPIPPGDRLTLLEAIVQAGGFTAKASRNRVRLVRNANGVQITKRVRVASILAGRGGHLDIILEPGDVVSVPEVWF